MKRKESKQFNSSINYITLDKAISRKLNRIKIDDALVTKYMKKLWDKYDSQSQEVKAEVETLKKNKDKLVKERDMLIKKNLARELSNNEITVYDRTLMSLENTIHSISNQIELLKTKCDHKLVEFDMFIQLAKNAGTYFKNSTYVRKAKIIEIFFSNIILH